MGSSTNGGRKDEFYEVLREILPLHADNFQVENGQILLRDGQTSRTSGHTLASHLYIQTMLSPLILAGEIERTTYKIFPSERNLIVEIHAKKPLNALEISSEVVPIAGMPTLFTAITLDQVMRNSHSYLETRIAEITQRQPQLFGSPIITMFAPKKGSGNLGLSKIAVDLGLPKESRTPLRQFSYGGVSVYSTKIYENTEVFSTVVDKRDGAGRKRRSSKPVLVDEHVVTITVKILRDITMRRYVFPVRFSKEMNPYICDHDGNRLAWIDANNMGIALAGQHLEWIQRRQGEIWFPGSRWVYPEDQELFPTLPHEQSDLD
jgi:hypothetical protein